MRPVRGAGAGPATPVQAAGASSANHRDASVQVAATVSPAVAAYSSIVSVPTCDQRNQALTRRFAAQS